VGTNTLLQRTGARVALITTKGFRDLLEIGRQTRPLNYDMHADFPPPVVPRTHRVEIAERVGADGEIVVEITDEERERVASKIAALKPEAVAIALIFSYVNPQHEQQIKHAVAAALPGVFISASSEVQPEFREYERFSTTAINAYLQPTLAHYFDSLGGRLATTLPGARVAISRSNGGLMSLEHAKSLPIRTALSGPAAGVVGAIEAMRGAKRSDMITFDMGGTSADVALVQEGKCRYRHSSSIGGFPIRMAVLDILTVGAGGGSVAWFDHDELLKVGPLSAGAKPGPACYGLGGTQPTVTDANLALGRLPSGGLLDGKMPLDMGLAREAIGRISAPLGLSIEDAARGILDIVTANMVRAIRGITVERGFDPRDFSLFAFGGAGPLHARHVAASLGVAEVLIPALPGILCAQGALASTFKEDIVRTVRRKLNDTQDHAEIQSTIIALSREARRWLASEGAPDDCLEVVVALEARYVGQSFELTIPLRSDEIERLPSLEEIRKRFLVEHERQYGFHSDDGVIEVVNIRLTATIVRRTTSFAGRPRRTESNNLPDPAPRQVWFDGESPIQTPVYQRTHLTVGQNIIGPAVIEQFDTTTVIFPGDELSVDSESNMIVTIGS
jgi:N-methylhydantoinase A